MQLTQHPVRFLTLVLIPIFTLVSATLSIANDQETNLTVFQKSQDRGIEFRPTVGMQWYSIDGRKISGNRMRAGWMGAKATAELALIRLPVLESGIEGSIFKSQTSLSSDAQSVAVTDITGDAYVQFKANSTAMGIPMVKLTTGFARFDRRASAPVEDQVLPSVNGLRMGALLSTYIDNIFTLGVQSHYTFKGNGVLELEGFLKHRLFSFKESVWDLKFSTGVGRMRIPNQNTTYEETWTTVFMGLSVAI